MNFPKAVENFFSNRKYHFWFAHLLFWLTVWSANFFLTEKLFDSFGSFTLRFLAIFSASILTYPLRIVYMRYNWHRFKLGRMVFSVSFCSIIVAFIWSYVIVLLNYFFMGSPLSIDIIAFIGRGYFNSFPIILWSSLYLGYKIWAEWNDQKSQLEQQQTLLKSSQLEMLKYQLNPHFLFNTLSSLRGLINVDPTRAREMVTQISEFLRYSLLEGKNNEVQLIKEIEIIKQYLNIEQVRYDEDLILEYDISPETKDLMIPIFLIHPLVENAVKHGMQSSQLPLIISIRSEIIDRNLQIEVGNSGHWIENDNKGGKNNSGIGLLNIQKRLEHSYPGNHSFEIIKDPEFVKVVIKINYSEHGQIN